MKEEEEKEELKIIKDLEQKILDEINEYFSDFYCPKCFFPIEIKIKRKKDNILYIKSKCKNNHSKSKPVIQFLKENKIKIDSDFILYDYYNDSGYRRSVEINPERHLLESLTPIDNTKFYYICFKCKIIYKLNVYKLNKFQHNHFVFGKIEKNILENKEQYDLEEKINEGIKYKNNLKNILQQYKLEQKYISYLNEIDAEIKFLSLILNLFSKKTIFTKLNLSHIINYQFISFQLNIEDLKISEDLNLCIKNLNSELLEVYSKNSMESLISTFKKYNLL